MAGQHIKMKAEITGLKELEKMLADASDKLERKVIRAAVKDLSEKLRQLIAAKAPSGTRQHTGASKALKRLRYSIEPGNTRLKKGWINNVLLANYYARFLEDGTEKIRAQPFVKPTIEEANAGLLQEFVDKLTKDIVRELEKRGN